MLAFIEYKTDHKWLCFGRIYYGVSLPVSDYTGLKYLKAIF